MKMVSAAKYARAERDLKPAAVYGAGATGTILLDCTHSLFLVCPGNSNYGALVPNFNSICQSFCDTKFYKILNLRRYYYSKNYQKDTKNTQVFSVEN